MPRYGILRLISLAALISLVSLTSFATTLHSGKCVGVTDGDSIFVMIDGREQEVRLEGVDCPEFGQAFCKRAKQFTSGLVFGKDVSVKEVTFDNYGRMIGRVFIGETDLSLELVRAGLAWHYKRYSKETQLSDAEVEARRNRRGLWADETPVAPWAFRHQGGVENQPQEDAPGDLHGNIKSKAFHNSSCPHYHCKNCIVIFKTREEARRAGYHPCGNCEH
jgi:endonuclease YncB( thermonuclease family)